MPAHRDTISVRTTQLNNIILRKGITGGVVSKAAERSASQSTFSVNSTVWDVVSRDGLLDAFHLLYNECDKESLKKRDRNIAKFVTKCRTLVDQTRELRVNCEDFNVKAQIGKGYFGSVHLVAERQTGDVYAMKKIKKSLAKTPQIMVERDIMARRCSDWITNLQYAFQDTDHLYLIMEFLPGGDLLSLMSRYGAFDEDLTRFYLAELSMAIHSLHEMGYIHRDIKPSNILIDRIGHIKLADFGHAAALGRDGQVVTLAPVGTPEYIAPELLETISTSKVTKSFHNVSCDFWSMGIIGYELIYEETPFHAANVHEIYSKILRYCDHNNLKEIITFPSTMELSSNYKSLIESLITSPTNRLNFTEIKSHTFFTGVKWQSLRLQLPPIKPNVNGEDDTSNFDEVERNIGHTAAQSKKSPTMSGIKSNDFSGRDLPFIGYYFVHMNTEADAAANDVRVAELNVKLNEKTDHMPMPSNAENKRLEAVTNIIKEKIAELGNAKKQIRELKTTMKLEADMCKKKEKEIAEMFFMKIQKYEESMTASEKRYEKIIVAKKIELSSLIQKLDARQSALQSKCDECAHLYQKIDNYEEILRQSKLQVQTDLEQFELNKNQLKESYEDKLNDLRNNLSHEKDSKSGLTLELSALRTELEESIKMQNEALKSNDEILKRFNAEIESNNNLQERNIQLEQQVATAKKASQELEHKIGRLERDLQVAECGQSLAQSMLVSPTAPSSLTNMDALDDQLRADLEVAKENKRTQIVRNEGLQATTILDNIDAKLLALREQEIKEHQSVHSANQSLWKIEKRLEETLTKQKSHVRFTEEPMKKIKEEFDNTKLLLKTSEAEKLIRDEHILELQNQIAALKLEVAKQCKMRKKVEEECLQIKSKMLENISRVHLAEAHLNAMCEIAQYSQLTYESLYKELDAAYKQQQSDKDLSYELQLKLKSRNHDYELLKYTSTIIEKQITEMEAILDAEQRRCKKLREKNQELFKILLYKDEMITELKKQPQEEKSKPKTVEGLTRVLNEANMQLKLSQQKLQEALDYQRKDQNDNETFDSVVRILPANKKKNLQIRTDREKHDDDMLLAWDSSKKENISPPRIRSSIFDLMRLKKLYKEEPHCKLLQEQIDHFEGTPKLALKQCEEQNVVVDSQTMDEAHKLPRKTNGANVTPTKAALLVLRVVESSTLGVHHRFELNLFDATSGPSVCIACKCVMLADSLCWHCKQCLKVAHRKCRPNVGPNCGAGDDKTEPSNSSVGKYSCNAELDSRGGADAAASIVALFAGLGNH